MVHPRKILEDHGFSPLKNFGQNFLITDHHLKHFPDFLLNYKKILEIGPGLGAISLYLQKKQFHLTLCEIDRGLSAYLIAQFPEMETVNADFMEIPVSEWEKRGITAVVSNLPFYITSPVIARIISEMPFIKKCIWGMQAEVAQRLLVNSGNSLSIFVNATGTVEKIEKVPPGAFYPAPEVSAMFLGWTRKEISFHLPHLELLLKASFWGKRKSLSNCLRKNPFFEKEEKGRQWSELFEQWYRRPEEVKSQKAEGKKLQEYASKRADELDVSDYLILLQILNSL